MYNIVHQSFHKFLTFQVVMADIENDLGAQTVAEFCQKFGQEKAVFHHCDNTKDEDVKG